jgi:hypothetical protein
MKIKGTENSTEYDFCPTPNLNSNAIANNFIISPKPYILVQ